MIIADPHCPDTASSNLYYGQASFSVDMTMSRLNVSLKFASPVPTHSCYLCQVVGGDYCNATLNNVALSNELAFNVMVALVGHSGAPILLDITDGNTFAISVTRNAYSCGPIDLVMIVFASTSTPTPMSFLTVVRDLNASTQRIPCDDNVPLFDEIDCSVVGPYYYYVSIASSNCIAESNASLVPRNNNSHQRDNKPLLYWYSEAVAERLPMDVLRSIVLCGNLDANTLLRESNLSYQCGQYASLYMTLRPWYALALQYVTVKLNTWRENVTMPDGHIMRAMFLSYDTLERTCLLRHTEESINNTILASLYDVLVAYNSDQRQDAWCETISNAYNRTDLDDGFIPYYLTLYKEWYFRYFSFFVLYSHDMALKVVIALALLSVACGIFICSLTIAPMWIMIVHCCRRIMTAKRRRELEQHTVLPYNDDL